MDKRWYGDLFKTIQYLNYLFKGKEGYKHVNKMNFKGVYYILKTIFKKIEQNETSSIVKGYETIKLYLM